MTHFKSALLLMIGSFLCSGCMPALHPIAYRLPPEVQAKVDQGWNTVLALPTDPDRQLVLDSLVATQLHHMGIDRFWFRAEKQFNKGWVVMTSFFERTSPSNDRFDIDILDHDRILLRRLSYTGLEVRRATADINGFVLPVDKSKDAPPMTEEEIAADAEQRRQIAARKERVKAIFNLDDGSWSVDGR